MQPTDTRIAQMQSQIDAMRANVRREWLKAGAKTIQCQSYIKGFGHAAQTKTQYTIDEAASNHLIDRETDQLMRNAFLLGNPTATRQENGEYHEQTLIDIIWNLPEDKVQVKVINM